MLEQIRAHVAHNSDDYTEIRIHGVPRKPIVKVDVENDTVLNADERNDDDNDDTINQRKCNECTISVNVRRSSLAGCWICILTGLTSDKVYSIQIGTAKTTSNVNDDEKEDSSSSMLTISFRTMTNSKSLGQHLLKIGILSDPHVNLSSYNGKRLYGAANELLQKYGTKLIQDHKVDCIVLPGDICDSGNDEELHIAANILNPLRKHVPVYAVIGNHEYGQKKFSKLLVPQNPQQGYYSVDVTEHGIHMIFLATNTQDSLNHGTEQLEWLQHDLKSTTTRKATNDGNIDIILVFLHYSLVLHPLHDNGRWDDGLQVLDNAKYVLQLLHSYPSVRAVICGHKNVPSIVIDNKNLIHTLSPQLIQVPCGYDVIDVYKHGIRRCVYEIEEIELQETSRRAAGRYDAQTRWGIDEHRSFQHSWA